jgi:hypothetical protein
MSNLVLGLRYWRGLERSLCNLGGYAKEVEHFTSGVVAIWIHLKQLIAPQILLSVKTLPAL